MSLGDFNCINAGSVSKPKRYQTKAGNTAINAGEWVIQGTGGDVEYVTVAADGMSSSDTIVGVAATTDTVTASADGEVLVWDDPKCVFRGQATTPSNLASTTLLTQVTLDVSSSQHLVDENDTASGTLLVIDYDRDSSTPAYVDVQMTEADHVAQ